MVDPSYKQMYHVCFSSCILRLNTVDDFYNGLYDGSFELYYDTSFDLSICRGVIMNMGRIFLA